VSYGQASSAQYALGSLEPAFPTSSMIHALLAEFPPTRVLVPQLSVGCQGPRLATNACVLRGDAVRQRCFRIMRPGTPRFMLPGTEAALRGTAEKAPAASRMSGGTGSTLARSEATRCNRAASSLAT